MINELIQNIYSSNLSNETKKSYIKYAENLFYRDLPVIFDVKHLEQLFKIPSDELDGFLLENTKKYTLKKKNGSLREVWKPNYKLKHVQKWIKQNILDKVKISESAHGFVKGRSILSNAQNHVHEEPSWVLTTDIKDFFQSIKKDEIRKVFEKIGYSESVSEAFSLLTTVHGRLVQGFPTSPSLSNICFKAIDNEFEQVANKLGVNYSRYADDISFSGLQNKGYTKVVKELKSKIQENFNKYGYRTNVRKTRLMKEGHTKIVTGLVLTQKGVKVPRKYYRRLNKELYYCEKFGVNEHLNYHNLMTRSNFKGYLIGIARFIYMIDAVNGAEFLTRIERLDWD